MSEVNIRNIRMFIAYDGSNYLGWQIQPKGPTIQGIIQDALSKILGHKVKLKSAGRTDAGVHAIYQTAHFLTTSDRPLEIIFKGVNAMLPQDIVVWKLEEVDFKFHSQRDLIKKTYVYYIYNYPIRNPLVRLYSWWVPEKLDLRSMEACLPLIIGEKDFASFRKSGTDVKTTIRTVYDARFKRVPGKKHMIAFEITGKGFMRYMVRNIVGTLVEVGRGNLTVEDFERILSARDRRVAPPPAPPQGLFLKKIDYPEIKVIDSYPNFKVEI